MLIRTAIKFISFIASSFAVLILSGFLTLQPVHDYGAITVAHANVSDECTDIEPTIPNQATPVIGAGDSGQLNFDAPGAPGTYQACGENNARSRQLSLGGNATATVSADFLQGWTWNTNLGDISMSCENGMNAGASCHSGAGPVIDYGSYITKIDPANNDTARIMGFSWGDKVGWISMGCYNGQNTQTPCVGNYGVQVALHDGVSAAAYGESCAGPGPGGTLSKGDIFGRVWTNSVGWMEMCGTHVNISNLDLFPPSAGTGTSVDVSANSGSPVEAHLAGDEGKVFANGTEYYELTLKVTEDGIPVPPASPTRAVTITMQDTNTIKADQVTTCNQGCDTATIVKFPGGNNPLSGWGWDANRPWTDSNGVARQGLYFIRISSIAPSSAGNSYNITGLTVSISNPARNNELVAPLMVVPNAQRELFFSPAADVTHIGGTAVGAETFQMNPNGTTPIHLVGGRKVAGGMPATANISVYTDTYSCTPNYDFIFDENNNGFIKDAAHPADPDLPLAAGEKSVFPNFVKDDVCNSNGRLIDAAQSTLNLFVDKTYKIYALFNGAGAPDLSAVNSLAFQTVISYTNPATNKVISYYSRKLADGSLANKAALVQGNVSLNIIDKLPGSEDWIAQAVGNNTVSNREQYLRAVKQVIGSKQPMAFDRAANGAATRLKVLKSNELSNPQPNEPSPGVLYYKNNNIASACQVILTEDELNAASQINAGRPVTLVTEGCDIYIDRSIRSTKNAQNVMTGNLGIIALQDYTMPQANKGANIYICYPVTDLEANIVTEGTVYSITTPNVNCGGASMPVRSSYINAATGSPNYPANYNGNLLARQLTVMGSLSSNNTYGGSLKNPRLLGDGRVADASQAILSQLQDINFLRYAQIEERTIDANDGWGPATYTCWATGYPLSALITPAGRTADDLCLNIVNSPVNKGAVNLIYRTPMDTQPVFSLVK